MKTLGYYVFGLVVGYWAYPALNDKPVVKDICEVHQPNGDIIEWHGHGEQNKVVIQNSY